MFAPTPNFALHAVNDNLQMQFAHPGNDRLAGLLVSMHDGNERIFRRQRAAGRCPFFPGSALVFGSIASEITGSGNSIRSRVITASGRTACRRVVTSFRPDAGGNITPRVQPVHFMAIVGLHQARCGRMRSFLPLTGIPDRIVPFQGPGIDADKASIGRRTGRSSV